MIIGGKYRTNGQQLGEYLGDYLQADKNDHVELVEIRGSASRGLTPSLASWEAEARGSKCKNPLWHAHLRTPQGENLTREQQIEAVNILERHLGFQGQPRAIVIHDIGDHEHVHVVWSRIRREKETIEIRRRVGKRDRSKDVDERPFKVSTRVVAAGTAKEVSFTKMKNVAAAREIETRFGLQLVDSPDFSKSGNRKADRENSKKSASQEDFAKSRRSKLDPIERGRTITALWQQTDSGKAFRSALLDAGYILARGDSRSFVVVDKAGDAHSLARQIKVKGVLKAQVDARLADLDPASVPRARHVQLDMWRARKDREAEELGVALYARSAAGLHPKSNSPGPSQTQESRQDDLGKKEAPADANSLEPAHVLAALTRQQSTFTKRDLHREIDRRLQALNAPENPQRVIHIADQVEQHNDCLILGKDHAGRVRYTSKEMFTTELSMRDSSDALAASRRHEVRQRIRDAAPSASRLGGEQRVAFEHVLSDAGLSIVIGYAGTGKSFAMGAAREAWEAAGYRVRGAALAGIAAQSLQQGSGIPSRTLQSLFGQLDRVADQEKKLADMDANIAAFPSATVRQREARAVMKGNRDRFAARIDATRLTDRDVIVLDEAGMVGSRQMNQLLAAAGKAGSKVVLVGDAEQLQAIDAGGAFRALTERHGAVKITEVRRQEIDWQRDLSREFGDGFAQEALTAYQAKGHIHQVPVGVDARERVVADWTASRRVNPRDTHVMLAYTKADVASLNQHGRTAFQVEKRLGEDKFVRTETGLKAFAAGDRFFFLENRRLRAQGTGEDVSVMNGSLGTVEKIELVGGQNKHRMTVKLDKGAVVEFDTEEYRKFDHGYASTVHKSQGLTAGHGFVLASQFMDRHAAGVAMTRHVKRVDMYYAESEFADFDHLLVKLGRDGRKDTTLDYLARAEKAGERQKYIDRVLAISSVLTREEERKRAFDRLAEAVRLRNDPADKERRLQRQQAAVNAAKLRDVLGEYPDRKVKRGVGFGRSA